MLHLEGREVGGCKLIRKIGEGGMGEVYLGEQIRVGNRAVAVKIVRAEEEGDSEQIADIARRFQREAGLLGNFNHPNILPVYTADVQGDLLYLVMQYAPDGSLADAIKGRTNHTLTLPASPAFVADLIGQVSAALQYTHDKGVVHRDVKPGNVLLQLEPNGHWHALLADFGIARGSDGSSHRTQVSGTLAYMAPEQFTGKFSPASDQYALAVMTYQLLTGHTPFEGDIATLTHGHMYGTPPSVRSYNAALPATVDGVLTRALAKDPSQRYPTVAEYGKALQTALAQKSAGGDVLPPPLPSISPAGARVSQGPAPQWPGAKRSRERQPSRPGVGRVWLALLAAIVLLVGIVGAGGYLVQQQQKQQAAQQTRTAQQTASSANAHATAAAQQTQTAQQTAAANQKTPIATASSTPGNISDNVTIPPAPPSGVDPNTTLVSDPSPFCSGGATTLWVKSSNVMTDCSSGSGVKLTATASDSLGCIARTDQLQTDGYVTAIAQPVSGSVVLGFRQGNGNPVGGSTATPGNSVNIKGYYFQIDPATNTYSIYSVDADGGKHSVANTVSLNGTLNTHFAVSVLYQGGKITPYINGIQLQSVTDTSIASGWMALCTSGVTTYTNALMYPLAS